MYQPQLFALHLFVVGIENLGQVFRADLLVDGAVVVAAVEGREIEGLGCFSAPQAQRIGGIGLITQNGRVVRHTHDRTTGHPTGAQASGIIGIGLSVTAELHLDCPLGPHQFPRIAKAQPLICALDLPAVDDILLEDTELITYAVAEAGDFQRRHRVNKAGCQSTQATITQAGLIFLNH